MSDEDGTPRLRITTTAELLKAVELGVVDKTEARELLGLSVKRGRLARLQPRQGGRFTKGDQVYPFNRFSASAKEAVVQAQALSTEGGRAHVDTADMLLAIVRQAGGAGARALGEVGIDEARVVPALAGVGRNEVPGEGVGTTLQLKGVVESAFHGVEYPAEVGTRHLLLALAAGEGSASAALAELGATAPAIRSALDRIAGEDRD